MIEDTKYLEFHFFHISLYDLASLGTLFSGLTLALLLVSAKRPERTANLFLSAALAVAVLKTGGLTPFFLPALGPLLYFYVRQLTSPDGRFHRRNILHFCILLVSYWVPTWLVLISVIVYLYLAHGMIEGFYRRLRPVTMDRPRFAFQRLNKALVLLGLFCLLSMFDDTICLTIALALIGMAVDVIRKADNGLQLTMPITDRSDAREKGRRLREVVATNRLYTDAELTLATLAQKLKIHPHDLSRMINQGLEKNFSDFINEFRVREIARKMRDPENDRLTLLGIAYDSGFNSERTFHRVFKELTGKTPLEYKNSLRKELPIDKLAAPPRISPLILRSESPLVWAEEKLNRNYMFSNYFKTTFRYLLQNRAYSFINIAGLSIGLACAMLILVYVQDEVSYDRFHQNVDQIYRIDKQTTKTDGSVSNGSYTGYFPGPRFAASIPEIKTFVRFQPARADIKTESDIRSQSVCLVDANFFSVFNFPLLSGNARSVLTEPNSAVITEEMAKKLFGSSNAVGKVIFIRQDSTFNPHVITGVAKNCPDNSSIKFQVLLPLKVSAMDESNNGNWFNSFLSTFVVLSPGAEIKALQNKMDGVFESDAGKAISEIKSKYKVKSIGISYLLEPLTAIHLGKLVPDGNEILSDKSNPEFSYILSAIAVFVLLIACINFVNLTIARSVKRAKEIGIRKVIGGTTRQLRIQFLSESFMLCLIAFTLALGIVVVILPVFSGLSNKVLSLSYLLNVKLIIYYIALFLITSLSAGIYPAMVLSNYHPVQTLYSRFNLAGKNYLQRALVVFQFALASFLIVGAITIYLQFNFLTTQNLGYDDHNLIVVNKSQLTRNEAAVFKQELMKNPNMIDVAPKNGGDNNNTVKVSGDQQVNIAVETIDAAYLPLLKVPVIAGRNFSDKYPADATQSALVNEAFVQEAGWKQPIGEQINTFNGESYTVVGVVKNYHYKPLTEKITPQFFTMNPGNSYGMLHIKIKPGTETASLQYIANTFKGLFPFSPFAYTFKQEKNEQSYASEARWKQIILFSAVLTIFISCIGLFGLSVLAVEKRVKEIGVRKVLGASVSSIVTILSADFVKLIFIALAISMPFAWIATNKWLQNYPYRITVSWWLFLSGSLLVVLIALITISFQSIRAAITNPVKSLRAE
ncbi:AraC-like DNA-binding protein [Mucilaginibacter gracilis]|uniref:Transcriptional regulator, AraC family n=2 Tax=Mucilaginibacter TaxID=423349 RepID=H1YI75_9SPHI|nr:MULTISPECIES: ABC transporter permease [Mucilaginibacter]EHQ26510.1 transcriptional regulator, AraC family [Mucilaginibacter paludis DSM 18603]RKR80449.1 AraC-like DNA-binding protein [Mucilaginibacter gracilis]